MDEPGHPEDLKQALQNWLREAQSNEGALPEGTDPIDWAIQRFIAYWEKPTRQAIRSLEETLSRARELCDANAPPQEIRNEIDYAFQIIGEDLRVELGLYEWNESEADQDAGSL
jgi:hypothetical protein